MKKIISGLLILTLGIMSIACGGGSSGGGSSEIRISGSTSVDPIIKKLAVAFEAKYPEHKDKVRVTPVGSSVGISDTINNISEIGMASRNIKKTEQESVDTIVLCYDGIVLVVNSDAALEEISKEQLFNLYMNGVAVSDISKPISREDGSGTRGAFTELTGIGEDIDIPSMEILNSTGGVKTSVSSDAQKIGYISLGSLDESIKALRYSDGSGDYVVPSVENVQNERYTLFRPFNLVIRKGATLSAGAQAFLDFCKTPEASEIILENGYIPLS